MKVCTQCKIAKSLDCFYITKTRPSGFRSSCKECMDKKSLDHNRKSPGAARKARSKYKEKYPDKNKNIRLKHVYGITVEDYKKMVQNQNNLCAICNRPERFNSPKTGKIQDLSVDHCHITGKVRGLLCRTCNSSLGKFKDSIEILESAIRYLKRHQLEQNES